MFNCTQNPNSGSHIGKRQSFRIWIFITKKICVIISGYNFPRIKEDELKKIAIGLGNNFRLKEEKILEDLVKFHKKWSNIEDIKDDVQCFTVREIAASVKAFSEGMNLFDTIMTIYGARYQKALKQKLIDLLRTYDFFKNIQSVILKYQLIFLKVFKINHS